MNEDHVISLSHAALFEAASTQAIWHVSPHIRLWLFRSPGGDHILGGTGVYLGDWQDQILQEEPHC